MKSEQPKIDLIGASIRFTTSFAAFLITLPFEIASAVLKVHSKHCGQNPENEERDMVPKNTERKNPIPILMSGIPEPYAVAISTLLAARELEFDVLPYMIAHDVWAKTELVINRETGQCFETIKPDNLQRTVESLKTKHPDMIIVDYSEPETTFQIAELCCNLDIPFVTFTRHLDTDQIRSLIDDSSMPAVIAPESDPMIDKASFMAAVQNAFLAIDFLKEKITAGNNGCFTFDDIRPETMAA